MPLFIFILALTMTEVRVDALLDTTAKLISLYPEMDGVDTIEAMIFKLTNIERKKKGLETLKLDYRLRTAARQHSDEMLIKNYMSHGSSNKLNKTSVQRIYNSGLPVLRVGENVAENFGSQVPYLFKKAPDSIARTVVRSWMQSPPHRKNILEPDFTHIGIGSAIKGETHKVTQNFADCSDFMVDSVVAKAEKGKYLLFFYISSLISDMRVFDDGNALAEDSLYIYSGLIGIPLKRDSSLHKVELCVKDQQLYRCGLRLFVHTGPPIETIFQPSSADYK